jgi:hypothetical protein
MDGDKAQQHKAKTKKFPEHVLVIFLKRSTNVLIALETSLQKMISGEPAWKNA